MTNDIIKYEHQFEEIRSIITMHREKALRLVNEESLQMSWIVGKIVSDRLKSNEWGSKVVTQLSEYLRTKDPSLKGYSRRNIYNMVTFYEEYSADGFTNSLQRLALPNFVQTETAQMAENEIVQTTSAQLPQILYLTTFSNHLEILNRCKSYEQRISEYMGQLEFYLEALDRDVKRSNENPSIGILLCQSADQSVVEYAMSRSLSPTMVAEYRRHLIPKEVIQKSLDEFCYFIFEERKSKKHIE